MYKCHLITVVHEAIWLAHQLAIYLKSKVMKWLGSAQQFLVFLVGTCCKKREALVWPEALADAGVQIALSSHGGPGIPHSPCLSDHCCHYCQVCNKIIFLMSFVGNCGTFTRGYRAMVLDVEFLYHLLYLLICAMGLFVHEFFYSLLVSCWCWKMWCVKT